MGTKQTAVEWLVEQLETIIFYTDEAKENTIEQAKQMEKEQIIKAYAEAEEDCEWLMEEHTWLRYHSENYYDKTYNTIK